MDAGEVKQFFLPYDKECMLGVGMNRVGVVDTYGRNSWCSRKQMVRARRRYLDSGCIRLFHTYRG